jgi:hypothetical protein
LPVLFDKYIINLGSIEKMAQKFTIKLRRDTGANWASVNPVLANGEPGYNTTTNQIKMVPQHGHHYLT